VTKFGTYYPKSYNDWVKKAEQLLRAALQKRGFNGLETPLYEYALAMDYTFVFQRPKYMYAKKFYRGRIHHDKRPDLDNCVKAVNDLFQKCNIIADDSLIAASTACKVYASCSEEPMIIVRTHFLQTSIGDPDAEFIN